MPLFVIVSVHLPFMTVVSTLLMERAAVADGMRSARPVSETLRQVARNLITNPIIIGIMAGVAWRMSGMQIPALPANVIAQIANATIPVALFSLGMSLRRYGIRGDLAPAAVTSALKIIALPAIVWLSATYVFHLPPLWIQVGDPFAPPARPASTPISSRSVSAPDMRSRQTPFR